MLKKVPLLLLRGYQRFISPLFANNSCRFYPTCSEYAAWQFEKNTLIVALYASTLRVLRCNQLFEGGFDYPESNKLCKKPSHLKYDAIKFWFVPNAKHRYYIVKNFNYKGNLSD